MMNLAVEIQKDIFLRLQNATSNVNYAQNIIFFVHVANNIHCHCALNKNLANMSVL